MFTDINNAVLYVGKAKSLKARVSSYFMNKSLLGDRTKLMVSQIDKIKVTIVESELEALLLEAFYIKKYKPKYNVKLTDNKSYIRLRITIKDEYPKILFARREEEDNSIYFGPYPSSGSLKLVLKTIRKVFPFQSVLNHPKRVCLYNHLGLCPCPPVNDSPELKKEYHKNIRGIIRMLEGESQKIMKELEKQRDQFSKKEYYEDAQKIQQKIKALSIITTPFRQPTEYDVNPNLRTDIRQKEMDELMTALNKEYQKYQGYQEYQGLSKPSRPSSPSHPSVSSPSPLGEGRGEVQGESNAPELISKLERIECYDISNIQGTNATGSMVVFVNGEKESSQYRRFKIKRDWEKKASHPGVTTTTIGSHTAKDSIAQFTLSKVEGLQNDKRETPNDFAMMKEVLRRRFLHDEWDTPDLVIVDGGKGQVSAALEILGETNIPLIGLAKREETIIIPQYPISNVKYQMSNDERKRIGNWKLDIGHLTFLEVKLPKDSPALHLITRIRDEAHRFAITYHRHLRSKAATT